MGAAANLAWLACNAPGHARFVRALREPAATQSRLLLKCLRANSGTAYGREHHLDRIRSVAEFQDVVPLATYDDLEPWIERIARGEPRVLTNEPVLRLVPSSGSTAAAKRIPYTATMKRQVRRAVAPWVFDLYRNRLRLASGSCYWSITPPAMVIEEASSAPVAVGYEEDGEYLGGIVKRLADATMAVPAAVRRVRRIESFRYVTLRFLLQRSDLSVISVWHPSFLTLLMDELPRIWSRLLWDLERGTLDPPGDLDPRSREALSPHLKALPRRARELKRVDPADWGRIWTRLGLVSCWGDGHAAMHCRDLERRLPGVEIQSKGLMATEGCVTIPLGGFSPLAVRSHFFEFLPVGDDARPDARPLLAHELERGALYSVVLTTGGGLYRYQLGDIVRAEGQVDDTPSLRFVGRHSCDSDLRGEKLCEAFVACVLDKVLTGVTAHPEFAMLAPDTPAGGPGVPPSYTLYIECASPHPAGLAGMLERGLRENPHYRACVELGQLRPARVFEIAGDAVGRYFEHCRRGGWRLGDIKPLALSPNDGWSRVFRGRYVDEENVPRAVAPLPAIRGAARSGSRSVGSSDGTS